MCGRVIQSSGPLNLAIVDGINVRDSRAHNYPPRWNAAPSQDLLVIRRNHRTGEVSLEEMKTPLHDGLICSNSFIAVRSLGSSSSARRAAGERQKARASV